VREGEPVKAYLERRRGRREMKKLSKAWKLILRSSDLHPDLRFVTRLHWPGRYVAESTPDFLVCKRLARGRFIVRPFS
jgi:hypothetical protein